MLKQLTVSSFPNMKEEARGRIHRKLHSQAYPDIYENQKPLSMEDAAKLMGAFNG